MLSQLLPAFLLLALCVTIHAIGLAELIKRMKSEVNKTSSVAGMTWSLVRIAWWLLALHLVEIMIWGVFYWLRGCLPDIETSVYFSGVTYATVCYGDLVLPHGSLLLAATEGLTGILLCGLSTGFFFLVLNRMSESTGDPTKPPK